MGSAFFLLLSIFDCVVIESQCRLCKYCYNVTIHMSPLKLLFFTSLLTQNNFFSHLMILFTLHNILWLPVDVACHNHSRLFHACFTIFMYINYHYSGCHAEILYFDAEKFDCRILPLKELLKKLLGA